NDLFQTALSHFAFASFIMRKLLVERVLFSHSTSENPLHIRASASSRPFIQGRGTEIPARRDEGSSYALRPGNRLSRLGNSALNCRCKLLSYQWFRNMVQKADLPASFNIGGSVMAADRDSTNRCRGTQLFH